jgi:hypothetical protein
MLGPKQLRFSNADHFIIFRISAPPDRICDAGNYGLANAENFGQRCCAACGFPYLVPFLDIHALMSGQRLLAFRENLP